MPTLFEILPAWSVLAPFFVAALALNLTPGADMTYVMARAFAQGRRAGLVSALAITAGSLVHTLAAAVGLAAVIAASPQAFAVVKYLGAGYLLYLAVKLILSRPGGAASTLGPARLARVFWEGVLVNVLNPKVALFMLAFLPQFVDPEGPHAVAQILILGTLFNLGGTMVNLTVAMMASAGGERLRHSTLFHRWLNRIAGGLLAALAVRLVLVEKG